MKSKQKSPIKHIPLRTCVVCHKKTGKRELVRVVCTHEGLEIDTTGRKAGRGAYLCPSAECWDLACNSDRLEHALRTPLNQENREMLSTYARSLADRRDN